MIHVSIVFDSNPCAGGAAAPPIPCGDEGKVEDVDNAIAVNIHRRIGGYALPQLPCDENQIQNADNAITIHIPGRQSFLHNEGDFMRSRRDVFPQ